ncbi:SCO3242 family prenyltransferase [Actinomadura sp. HBU206391]|uniref:SCO3242 family prenyltransferase n=1 Tax=Actinomadura sp. HBU206391 TaxID=2731692 RepID=UPI001650783F|nr:UbiA family prenyltransferase [Actinomadura sp. HBU206391]MBC6458304.1 UbiA family prenyltransferase [Actinomadura sp. HBU206391]
MSDARGGDQAVERPSGPRGPSGPSGPSEPSGPSGPSEPSGPRRSNPVEDLLELVRAPAALSVPGDILCGAAAAGVPHSPRTAVLAGSAVCLYWAGMALNDFADRDVDAVERPERPIPSGRVRPATALAVASGLTGAGLTLAAAGGGRRALAFAVPLAAAIWGYDLVLKATPTGPAAMATCRGLDVMLGASTGRPGSALPAALAVGTHTYAVTLLSRSEVGGGTSRQVKGAAAVGGLAVPVVVAQIVAGRRGGGAGAAAGLLGRYVVSVGGAQLAAARRPSAERVRHAVGAGILGLIPLQASLTAARGRPVTALALAAAHPLARRLTRKVSAT